MSRAGARRINIDLSEYVLLVCRTVRPHIGLRAFLLPAVLSVAATAAGAPLTVYDDQLRNGFADWSWATHNLSQAACVDDVQLLENTTPPPPGPVAVAIDPAADRHPVSPLIYGVNFG